MNLLSFNKTNPNLTLNAFKEHKSTRSETQKNKFKNTNPFRSVVLPRDGPLEVILPFEVLIKVKDIFWRATPSYV